MEAIGQVAGGLAHDFGNLLMAIRINVECLEGRTLDPSDEAVVQSVIAELDRGTEAVRSLLIFARGGSVEMRPTDPKAEIDQMAGLLGRTIKSKTGSE